MEERTATTRSQFSHTATQWTTLEAENVLFSSQLRSKVMEVGCGGRGWCVFLCLLALTDLLSSRNSEVESLETSAT